MDWRSYQPKHIPRWVWVELTFRWDRLYPLYPHAEIAKESGKPLPTTPSPTTGSPKPVESVVVREPLLKKIIDRQKKLVEREKRKRERAEELKRKEEERVPLRVWNIRELDRHVYSCGHCQRSQALCKTGRAILKTIKT